MRPAAQPFVPADVVVDMGASSSVVKRAVERSVQTDLTSLSVRKVLPRQEVQKKEVRMEPGVSADAAAVGSVDALLAEPLLGAGCPGSGVAAPLGIALVRGDLVCVVLPFRSGEAVAVPLAAGTRGVVAFLDSDGDAPVFLEESGFVVVFSGDFDKLVVGF